MPSSASCERHLEAGRRALSLGDLATAESELVAAVLDAERTGAEPQQLAAALAARAQLLYQTKRFAEAAPLFRRALETREEMEGADSAALVPAIHNLAAAYLAMGDATGAEPLLRKALAVLERNYGAEHAELAGVLNNLSQLYLKRGAHAEAEPLLRRLLAILRAQGDERPEVATVMASLASVHHALAEHDAAEQLLRRVLEIRERTLAPNHFAVATTLEALAETCATRGKLPEALALLERALGIRERTLGGTHPSLALVRSKMADLQLQLSQDAFAVPLMEPMVESRREVSPNPAQLPQSEASVTRPSIAPPSHDAIRRFAAELNQNGGTALAERIESSSLAVSILPTGGALVLPGSSDGGQPGGEELFDDLESDRAQPARSPLLARSAVRIAIGAAALIAIAVSTTFALKAAASGDDFVPIGDYASTDPGGQTAGGSVALPVVPTGADAAGASDSVPSEPAANPGDSNRAARSPAGGSREPRTPQPSTRASSEPEREDAILPVPSADRLLGRVDVPASAEIPAVEIGGGLDTRSALSTLGNRDSAVGSVAYSARNFRPAAHIGPVPTPSYPSTVVPERIRGQVVVRFTVDTNGRVEPNSFRIESASDMRFVAPITEILPQLRFMPAELNGRRVEQTLLVPFRFEPGRREEDGGTLDSGVPGR